MRLAGLLVAVCGLAWSAAAQEPSSPALAALPKLPAMKASQASGLQIVRDVAPTRPFSVVGPRGALLGEQSGQTEGWIFPWKLFSGLRISARMQDYPVPIDVNEYASGIDVQPDHTTITYAHANFTVRQVMFAPAGEKDGLGVAAYFEVESVRPMDLTFSFTPEMKRIWPAASGGAPSPEWVATAGGSGFYLLHLDLPGQVGAMAIPGAEPGILAPYQERPQTYPLQFVLHVTPSDGEPKTAKIFPLLMAMGETEATSTAAALHDRLMAQDNGLAESFARNRDRFAAFLKEHTAVETPDAEFDRAFQWAEVSIDQLQVQLIPSERMPGKETALVAGFFGSGASARPGFGWFFGRDALWTLYAVNSYGDFQLSREEMEFLLRRQRADGKILHEWSQAAELVDWASLPYEWAAADATPMLLMEMEDYRAISGDQHFVDAHWEELAKAWRFVTTHDADGDGVYDNAQGTAWVESWPPGMPHQEIYLAAVDEQASTAFAKLARAAGHVDLAKEAEARAAKLRQTIEREYYLSATQSYAFSHNADGTTDASATIFPTVAWWDGTYALDKSGPMFSRWASSEFSTDWGTRDLSPQSPFYDPISYHQGTVWPLYTGWTSLAEYRAGRPLSGYAHLMQNAGLTWTQDLGNVTELLSGEFFRPLGRSTSHQLWSAAMVISPALRGLFGVGWNAATGTITLDPHLPATWDHATVRRLPIGSAQTDLVFERVGEEMVVRATGGMHLASAVKGARASGAELRLPLPAVEVAIAEHLPREGDMTHQMKVLDQTAGDRSLTLRLAAMAGAQETIAVRRNRAGLAVRVEGATIAGGGALETMTVEFPAGTGYVEKTVRLTW